MWVWNGTINPKKNPFAKIKREIVEYHLKLDLNKAKEVDCIYTSMCLSITKYGKKYQLYDFFQNFGVFKNSEHRIFFLYSFLDTCAYSRTCPKCSMTVKDVLQHTLNDCANTSKLRLTLRIKLILYNAHKLVDSSKLSCKKTLYCLAMQKRVYREALCEYLVNVGYYPPKLNK